MSWPKVKLGDVAVVGSGSGFPTIYQGDTEGVYPFYKVSDMNIIGNEKHMSSANNYITEEVRNKLRAKVFVKGSIIFPKIGAAIATNKKRILTIPSCVDNNVMVVTPIVDKLNPRYLYHLFQSINLSVFASSSNPPSMRKTTVEDFRFSLPPLGEQKRIAAILDKANEIEVAVKITKYKQRDMIRSAFLEMFGDPNLNLMNWDENTLESLCVEKVGVKAGPFGSSLKKEMYSETGYKIYGQEQVIAGNHTIGDYYIPEDIYQRLESCKIESGDLLISLVGSIGRTLVIPDVFEPGIINPRLLRIRAKRELIYPDFLKVFLALPEIQLRLMGNSHGQTMPVLNGRIMKKISIITPPLSLQKKFLESLDNIDKMLQRTDSMVNESNKLAKAITQDLLS